MLLYCTKVLNAFSIVLGNHARCLCVTGVNHNPSVSGEGDKELRKLCYDHDFHNAFRWKKVTLLLHINVKPFNVSRPTLLKYI